MDIRSYDLAGLHINSVRLLEIQRRKTEEDEQRMKLYLSEGYFLLSEVKSVNFEDKLISLHVRTEKFGRLSKGLLVPVNNCLVNKMKTAFHYLDDQVLVVFALNGYIWIQQVLGLDEGQKLGGFKDSEDGEEKPTQDRAIKTEVTRKMIRLKSIAECLDRLFVVIAPETLFGVFRKFAWEAGQFRDQSRFEEVLRFVKDLKKME